MLVDVSFSKKLYFSQLNKHSFKFFNIFLMSIQAAFVKSPLGIIVIKATEELVQSVLFLNTLKHPQKKENIITSTEELYPLLSECKTQLEQYFEGTRFQFDLPVKQAGTAFQQKVWTTLLSIPYGKTSSYLDVSKQIGNIKATRAVGTTNGCNQVSIIVPCHRVIGSNGALTGYGGDLWRKKWLLEHENKYANGVQTLF